MKHNIMVIKTARHNIMRNGTIVPAIIANSMVVV